MRHAPCLISDSFCFYIVLAVVHAIAWRSWRRRRGGGNAALPGRLAPAWPQTRPVQVVPVLRSNSSARLSSGFGVTHLRECLFAFYQEVVAPCTASALDARSISSCTSMAAKMELDAESWLKEAQLLLPELCTSIADACNADQGHLFHRLCNNTADFEEHNNALLQLQVLDRDAVAQMVRWVSSPRQRHTGQLVSP